MANAWGKEPHGITAERTVHFDIFGLEISSSSVDE